MVAKPKSRGRRTIVRVGCLLALVAVLSEFGCSAPQQRSTVPSSVSWDGLDPDERDLALSRGRDFRGEAAGEIHRLEHVYRPGDPRMHPDSDAAVFVLSGTAIVQVEGEAHRLKSGESIDIPHGHCYATRPEGRTTSSLFFVFWKAAEQEDAEAGAEAPIGPAGHLSGR